MHEHARALDVAQETVAEPRTFVRAFDQAGDVDHHERFEIRDAHDAELRLEGGERVVGDLRPRRADDRQQRRLAGVGQTDHAGVREQLELQLQLALLAGLAVVRKMRRLARRRREMLIALTAAPAFGDAHAFVRRAQVGEQPRVAARAFWVDRDARDERADGDAHDELFARRTGLVVLAAAFARFRAELFLETKVDQRAELGIGDEHDVPAAPAVTAGGAAFRHVLLAPPCDDAVAAVAGGHVDDGLVDELHGCATKSKRAALAALFGDCAEPDQTAAGMTFTCFLSRELVNVTCPSTKAKSV